MTELQPELQPTDPNFNPITSTLPASALTPAQLAIRSGIPNPIPAGDISGANVSGITTADNNKAINNQQTKFDTMVTDLQSFLTQGQAQAQAIAESMKQTPEEIAAAQKLAGVTSGIEQAQSELGARPGIDSFTLGRGQSEIQRQNALQVSNLQRQLTLLQGTRQQKLDAAKFLYDANRNSLLDTLNLYKATAPDNISTQVDPVTGKVFVITRNPLTGTIGKQETGITVGNKDELTTVNNLIQKYPDAGIDPKDSLVVASAKVKNSKIFAKEIRGSDVSRGEERDSFASAYLNSKKGNDGYVSAGIYQEALRKFITKGGTQSNFFASFPQQTYLRQQEIDKLPAAMKPAGGKRLTASTVDSQAMTDLLDDIKRGATLQQLYSAYSELSPSLVQSIYYNQ